MEDNRAGASGLAGSAGARPAAIGRRLWVDGVGGLGGVVGFALTLAWTWIVNSRLPWRKLQPATCARLRPLFPTLDLQRVRYRQGARLLPNLLPTRSERVLAMALGYTLYFAGRDVERSPEGLAVLVHELVHVDQVRRRGDSRWRFARDYGRGYLAAGSYAAHPLELEARAFVARQRV